SIALNGMTKYRTRILPQLLAGQKKEGALPTRLTFALAALIAFANAGVSLQGVTVEGLTSLLPLGIIAGLFIGKPLGISVFC
ncbi:Na+/H+ antiporter NhaA, partial [Klebsiella michiganensis]|uniref:Na+/H+ antiporter NhaA n=1 Tax=Klebsiella michiganensis TaxID=1134687 RepID=UPI001E313431